MEKRAVDREGFVFSTFAADVELKLIVLGRGEFEQMRNTKGGRHIHKSVKGRFHLLQSPAEMLDSKSSLSNLRISLSSRGRIRKQEGEEPTPPLQL